MSSSITQSTNVVSVQDPDTTSPTIPQCYCGLDAIPIVVKKEGRNKGKYFWRCPKFNTLQNDNKCNFFRWVDQKHPLPSSLFSFASRPAASPTLTLTATNVSGAASSSQNTDADQSARPDDAEPSVVPTYRDAATSSSKGKEPEHGRFDLEILQGNSSSPVQLQRQIAIPKSRTRPLFNPETGIAQFSTEQMISIVTQHLNRQEYFATCQERSCKNALAELQETEKEITKLKEEMSFLQRENNVLQREKDLLKRALDDTKEEIEAYKRQRV